MNRAQRRAEKWHKLNPRLAYDEFTAEAGPDSTKVMMAMLRKLVGPEAPFDDETLWNSVRRLIEVGLLDIHFRFGLDGVEIEPEFKIPPGNDNHLTPPGGAAA